MGSSSSELAADLVVLSDAEPSCNFLDLWIRFLTPGAETESELFAGFEIFAVPFPFLGVLACGANRCL